MKGDRVEILVDAGSGSIQRFEIEATRAGRRVETSTARGVVEVTEVTRGGTPVRSGRFMASRVVAVVEHPAAAALDARVEEVTSRRLSRPGSGTRQRPAAGRRGDPSVEQLRALPDDERATPAGAIEAVDEGLVEDGGPDQA